MNFHSGYLQVPATAKSFQRAVIYIEICLSPICFCLATYRIARARTHTRTHTHTEGKRKKLINFLKYSVQMELTLI